MSNDRSNREPPSLGEVRPEPISGGGPATGPRSRIRTSRPAIQPRDEPSFAEAASPRTRASVAPRTMQDPPPRIARPAPPPRYAYDPVDSDHPRRPSRLRRAAFTTAGVILALVAAAVAALTLTPPVDLVRQNVIAAIESQTGRKLAIASARIDVFGGLGMSMTGLSLSAPPAMGGRPLIAAERLDASLAFLPLILREVKIERLTLVKPVLDLRVDASGRRNWDFASLAPPLRYAEAAGPTASDAGLPAELKEFARNAAAPPGASRSGGFALDGVSFADVRIVGGRLRYEDAQAGIQHELAGIDAVLSMPIVGGPLSLKGHVVLAGERIAVDGRIDQLRELLARRSVTTRLELDGKPLKASYDGRIASGSQLTAEGRLSLQAPSATALAAMSGLPLANLPPLGPLAFDGQVKALPASLAISASRFALGRSSGSGTLAVEFGGDRPRAQVSLQFASLDLAEVGTLAGDLAAAPQPKAPVAGRHVPPVAPSPAEPARQPPRSIDDILEQSASPGPENLAPGPEVSPATRVRGFLQRAGNRWETEAIDAGLLRAADVDARIQVASLHADRLDASGVHGNVELKAGVLRLNLVEAQVAGGRVRGLASLDARGKSLVLGANLSGDGVALKPLLAAAGAEAIEGRGHTVLTVSAEGGSERELVSTLAGKAEFKVVDGAVLGWDADAILAGLAQGRMPSAHREPGLRTPFRELSATFQITTGVARSRDIKLDAPTFQASGTGTVNMVDRNLDLLLKPRVAASGLEVPVRVAGTWDDPSVVADLNAALKSPQAQEAVRHLKNGDVEGALRSVLGNDAAAEQKIGKAKEALRGLLQR